MLKRVALAAFTLSMIPILAGCGGSTLGSLLGISTPSISSIAPSPATRGSIITISGSNLSGPNITVFFTSTTGSSGQAIGSSGGTSMATATVPTGIPAGTYSVYVQSSDTTGDVSLPSNTLSLGVN